MDVQPDQKEKTANRRSPFGWALTAIGVVIILITLAVAVVLAAPGFMGWQQMTVLTGSMEPEIPVGSMVYIEGVDPLDLQEGDIVTFAESNGNVITHRVVQNRGIERDLVTKGDANAEEDMDKVPYDRVIGKVVLTLPAAGDVLGYISSDVGKVYTLAFGACGLMFVILGGRMRKKPKPTAAERLESIKAQQSQ